MLAAKLYKVVFSDQLGPNTGKESLFKTVLVGIYMVFLINMSVI